MHNLDFRPLDESNFRLYESWFADSELSRRIERPTKTWFDYIRSDPLARSWMVYDGELPVGEVQVDEEPSGYGSLAMVVNPALRNRGYETSILQAVLRRPELAPLHGFEGYAEPDNLAARKCCEAVGFDLVSPEPDEEGFLKYVYERTEEK